MSYRRLLRCKHTYGCLYAQHAVIKALKEHRLLTPTACRVTAKMVAMIKTLLNKLHPAATETQLSRTPLQVATLH